jgi:hypothetical protein
MLPAGIACGIGMFLFGYTLSIGASAYLCAFLQGVMMVGVLIGIFSSLTYGLDAFRSQSNEIFVMNMLFKVRPLLPIVALPMLIRLELHVLWSLQLRQRLGGRQGSAGDHVRLRRHVYLPLPPCSASVRLRQTFEGLVESERLVCQTQHDDQWACRRDGIRLRAGGRVIQGSVPGEPHLLAT